MESNVVRGALSLNHNTAKRERPCLPHTRARSRRSLPPLPVALFLALSTSLSCSSAAGGSKRTPFRQLTELSTSGTHTSCATRIRSFKTRSVAVALFGAATLGTPKRKSLAIQVKLIRVIVEQGRGERQGGLAKLGSMRPPQQSVRSQRMKVDPA